MGPWLVAVRQWLSVDLEKKAAGSAWALEVEPTMSRPKNNDSGHVDSLARFDGWIKPAKIARR